MKNILFHLKPAWKLIILLPMLSLSYTTVAQDIKFGIHVDPLISWFSTDTKVVRNDGARTGFNFGVTVNKYFSPYYSFSTGINIITAGGRTVSSDTVIMVLGKDESISARVLPGSSVIYKIQYLSIPLGLKLETSEIGFITLYSDFGIDPKFVIGGKADIPSLDISNEKAIKELKFFNLSYHINLGIEYSFGGNTAMMFGLGFDNNFLDITNDRGDQPPDKVTHKLLSFRVGLNF
jgi:hypothetical protein